MLFWLLFGQDLHSLPSCIDADKLLIYSGWLLLPLKDAWRLAQKAKRVTDKLVPGTYGLCPGDITKCEWLQIGLRYTLPFDYEVRCVRYAAILKFVHLFICRNALLSLPSPTPPTYGFLPRTPLQRQAKSSARIPHHTCKDHTQKNAKKAAKNS